MIRRIIVVGGSAGGVEPILNLVAHLSPDLEAAVFIALHTPPEATSALPRILSRRGPLPATHARHADSIREGRIYVAPPDHHLLVYPGEMRLVRGPRENGHRPAVDPMFRSAADAYGPRVIGVIVSGALSDGAAGLRAVKQRGGVALVQDPDEAAYPSMPWHAMEASGAERLAATALGERITELVSEPPAGGDEMQESGSVQPDELEISRQDASSDPPGRPSKIACPDCGGVLWEDQDADPEFRCRVGHAYAVEALHAENGRAIENALWAAVRALEESSILASRISERAQHRGSDRAADAFSSQARTAERHAEAIREILYRLEVGRASGSEV